MKIAGPRIYPLKIPTSEYPNLGDRLQCAMNLRNITSKELAKQLFITQSTISGYRTGLRLPSCYVLKQLALELNVSSDFLLGLDEYIYVTIDEKRNFDANLPNIYKDAYSLHVKETKTPPS